MGETTPVFDFLSEIQRDRTYYLLFPSRQQGLAIIRLYLGITSGKFSNSSFKEEDLYDALRMSHGGDETYLRTPQEHFVELIGQLKEYFLIYDDESQAYYLKEYAYEFCRHAEKILAANFSPTKIEVLCSELLLRLNQVEEPEQLRTWMDVHFDLFKPEMKSQVDFLDRQIDQAVVELRLTAGVHNQSILDIVKQIDSNLDRLRDQNKELRAAFRQMKAIRNRLELLSLGINSVDLYEKVSLAREFFPEVKLRLSLIDRRLDRIHPKLRQFFSTLNKPLFNSRVEKFLGYLLNHSSLEYSKGKKVLVLPPNVSLPQLNISVPRLPILERKENLFPARARTVQDFDEDHQQTERLWKSLRSSLQVQDEIEEWHERIINDVKAKSSVRFSDYFFNLAERKQGSFELPIKLAHRFIKSGFLLPAYTIDVKDEIIQNEKFPGVAICEMNIYLK